MLPIILEGVVSHAGAAPDGPSLVELPPSDVKWGRTGENRHVRRGLTRLDVVICPHASNESK